MVLAASLLYIQSVMESEGFSPAWASSRSPPLWESPMSLAALSPLESGASFIKSLRGPCTSSSQYSAFQLRFLIWCNFPSSPLEGRTW